MSLFDPTAFTIEDVPAGQLTADQRRTIRARVAIAAGRHPANNLPIDTDHKCRDCQHLVRVGNGNRHWLKCPFHRLGRSMSAASDMRASWPACPHFEVSE